MTIPAYSTRTMQRLLRILLALSALSFSDSEPTDTTLERRVTKLASDVEGISAQARAIARGHATAIAQVEELRELHRAAIGGGSSADVDSQACLPEVVALMRAQKQELQQQFAGELQAARAEWSEQLQILQLATRKITDDVAQAKLQVSESYTTLVALMGDQKQELQQQFSGELKAATAQWNEQLPMLQADLRDLQEAVRQRSGEQKAVERHHVVFLPADTMTTPKDDSANVNGDSSDDFAAPEPRGGWHPQRGGTTGRLT